METHDAVIVGARCAGATLALASSRIHKPSVVFTPERLQRWYADPKPVGV